MGGVAAPHPPSLCAAAFASSTRGGSVLFGHCLGIFRGSAWRACTACRHKDSVATKPRGERRAKRKIGLSILEKLRVVRPALRLSAYIEIGRASCRERV